MGRFFNLDSPVMVALTKMADLIIVNLLLSADYYGRCIDDSPALCGT